MNFFLVFIIAALSYAFFLKADQCTKKALTNPSKDLPSSLDPSLVDRAHCIMQYLFEPGVTCDEVF